MLTLMLLGHCDVECKCDVVTFLIKYGLLYSLVKKINTKKKKKDTLSYSLPLGAVSAAIQSSLKLHNRNRNCFCSRCCSSLTAFVLILSTLNTVEYRPLNEKTYKNKIA